MYAVGRIGSYITRGVYTVSGPFHPFGGAVDIVVVEQPDGSFKSSPWYVRFGKFQGVLKAREKVVNICVNGVEANIHMYLDERGEAYFLREVEEEEDEESVLCSSPTGDEDGQSKKNLGPKNSKSCNDNGNEAAAGDQIDARNGKILSQANSPRRSRSIGFLFGRRSRKKDSPVKEDGVPGIPRISSLDRAEIAADLLEVKWCTNLDALPRGYDASQFSASDKVDGQGDVHVLTNDEESRERSPMHDSIEIISDNHIVAKERGFCSVEKVNSSHSRFVSLEHTVEGTDIEMLNLPTAELPLETSGIDKNILEGKFEEMSEISTIIDEPHPQNNDLNGKTDSVISKLSTSDSQIPMVIGGQACREVDMEQTSGERGFGLPGFFVSDEVGQSENCQSFVSREVLESSGEQTHETMYVDRGESMQVQFCARTFETIAKSLSEDKDHDAKNIVLENDRIEVCKSSSQHTNTSPCMHGHDEVKLEETVIRSETCACIVSVDSLHTSAVDVDLMSSCSIPHSNCIGNQIQDENNIIGGQPEIIHGGHGPIEATNFAAFESSDEEQFLFSDLDDFKPSKLPCESKCLAGVNKDIHRSVYLEGNTEKNEPSKTIDASSLFPEQLVEENQNPSSDNLKGSSSNLSSPISIPKVDSVDAEIVRMVESLPVWSHIENLDSDEVRRPFSHSLDLKSKSMEWTFHIKENSHSMNLDVAIESQTPHKHLNSEESFKPEGQENLCSNPAPVEKYLVVDPTKAAVASGGSWKLWPFSFRRSKSENSVQPAPVDIIPSEAENISDNYIGTDRDKNVLKAEDAENKIRSKTPTSEQLASLNLMEGKNVVTFTFSTTVLGKQQVDARIFLWKWDTRIVISDVDGTITRSDVLGQFMPLVGVDWSQTGVAHLFSAIKENGYQLLFLSARSISQAYITRQFLINLKQDGKALPEGPVVISPDGLFPSLYREVIRRAPHEFKIACLEDIRVLFPPDCSPFYAGFGNRDTDEISYLKVGIPKGKIFIINPKGEVAVHRRVDTKSYTSLHALVHDMFPPSQSFEKEDFNSWNFWKLPSPFIDSGK